VKEGVEANEGLMIELKDHVAKKIGAIAKPDTSSSPPTCRRPVGKDHAAPAARHRGRQGARDTTTLADPKVVEKLKEQYQEEH